MTRTGKTSKGKIVELGTVRQVEGGFVGYVMHRKGFAVQVFIPA